MGGGRNCTLQPVAGAPISKWTCRCGRGYWDSGKQKEVLGGPVGRGEAASRAEYEAHKEGCATCRNQAEEDDWNSLHRDKLPVLEPVCNIERKPTNRHDGREGRQASLESQGYGDWDTEQPTRGETRRHVSRDRIPPSTHSQRGYSDSGARGTSFSRHEEAPFYTLFPREDTAQRTISTAYQPSSERPERPQEVRVSPKHAEALGRDSKDGQHRESFARGGRDSNIYSRDPAVIQDNSRDREPSIKPQIVPAQSPPLSMLARRFVALGLGHYSESLRFISDHPTIVAQSEIDALVAEALIAEQAGQSSMAQTCIHQAMLLREYQKLGQREAVDFIRKLEARDNKARETFVGEVKRVYSSIQEKATKSLQEERAVASETYSRKVPTSYQATDNTYPPDPSAYTQSQPRTMQAQTQVTRDRDARPVYRDDQGRIIRPAASRNDPDRRRSVVNPAQTTMQQYRGATSESDGRTQPTISQTAERTAYRVSTTGREIPDNQREPRYPGEDVSSGMARLQIETTARSGSRLTRAEAEEDVIDRLRRTGRTVPSRQELERLIDDQLQRFARQKR
jgi:hypothetical protein